MEEYRAWDIYQEIMPYFLNWTSLYNSVLALYMQIILGNYLIFQWPFDGLKFNAYSSV